MAVISVLDKSVYELIAAGEVIERPASVIKELMENSVDAGSTSITVEIKNGGRTYIRVTDNGCGISHEDIPRAFLRHATSKLKYKDDLDAISTLGFRGEALASVCAVSKVDMLTKRPEDDFGIHYAIEGGTEVCYEESGCPNGTTITVRDLFYNVPARLKFLKKDVTEANAVANMVSKIALSHPEISFKFIRDNKSELVTSGDGKIISATYAVLGKDFYGTVIPVDYSYGGVTVKGYVTKPLMSKATRAYQNFFVNQRYVKSVTCMVALEEAYRNMIMTGKFPGCVLMVDIDPANLDVNVHPAKIEIRFSDEKPVYEAIYFGVKNALMTFDKPMEAEINLSVEYPKKKILSTEDIFGKPQKKFEQISFASSPASLDEPPVCPESDDSVIFTGSYAKKTNDTVEIEKAKPFESAKLEYKYISDKDIVDEVKNTIEPAAAAEPEPMEFVGELFKTYIVVQRGEEMYFIDKHAAHERYNFDRLKKGISEIDIQNLLSPIEVMLSYDAYSAVTEELKMLERFGFRLEIAKAPMILVHGVPILLTDEDPTDLLTEIAVSLVNGRKEGGDAIYDELYHSVACKASIKANSLSSPEELTRLAKMVIDNEIRYCPHGRPALVKLTKYELEKLFKRVV